MFISKQAVAQSTANYNYSEHNNKYTVKDIIYTTLNQYKINE